MKIFGLGKHNRLCATADKSIVLSEQKRNGESGYKTSTITSVEYENNANSK